MLSRYLERYELVRAQYPHLKPVLLTLTLRNTDDLGEGFGRLSESLRVLLDRRRDWFKKGRGRTEFRKVHGLVGSYEVTNRGKGWHPHAHMVALVEDWIDRDALAAEWHELTGDSFIVDVRRFGVAQDPAEAFCEVFKYAVKFSDMRSEDVWRAYGVLKGRRLVYSAGSMWGVKVPDDLNDDPIHGIEPVLLYYRYLRGIGYSFVPWANQQTA